VLRLKGIIIKFVGIYFNMEQAELLKLRSELPRVTEKFIDVEGLFMSKNPSLARLIPGFVYAYLKRVIHQDKINKFLYSNRDSWGLDFVEAIVRNFEIRPIPKGEENIPVGGRYLMAANHPLGGLDAMAWMYLISQVRKDILFPVNDLLMNIPNLYELFIPINKHGSNAENIRLFNKAFASDDLILYFPAGLVSRKISGQIRDLEWKKTFLAKAKAYQRDIIPVHIGGRNSNFFYNLADWRKKLGIKANIEMLYLADEMFGQKDKTIQVTFGKAISYLIFDKSKSDQQWASLLREHVYELGKDPQAEFKI
jgi:putative hemolysin